MYTFALYNYLFETSSVLGEIKTRKKAFLTFDSQIKSFHIVTFRKKVILVSLRIVII